MIMGRASLEVRIRARLTLATGILIDPAGAILFTVYAKPTSNPIEYPLSKIFRRTVET